MNAPKVPAVLPEDEAVPLTFDDDRPTPIIDTEVSEPLLDWAEAQAWLDKHAPDWRQFRSRPPHLYAFGRHWWDVRELREWIGR